MAVPTYKEWLRQQEPGVVASPAAYLKAQQAQQDKEREQQLYGGPQFDPASVGQNVSQFQDYAREGVQAYGEMLRPEFQRQVGETLGGLNSIGALRSGGTKVALNDLSRTYADRVGAFARGATLDAIGQGASNAYNSYGAQRGAFESDRNVRLAEEERKRQAKAATWRAIGSVLGAGIGAIPGLGTAGKVAGAVGGAL